MKKPGSAAVLWRACKELFCVTRTARESCSRANAKVVVLTIGAIVMNYNSVFSVFSEVMPGLATTRDVHADVCSTIEVLR